MGETRRRAPAVFDRVLGEYQPAPQYIAFPEFQEPPAAASPVVAFRYGQYVGDEKPAALGFPRFESYSFFEGAPQPFVPRFRQVVLPAIEAPFVRPQFYPLMSFQEGAPAPANPVIAFRYGWVQLARPEAFIEPRFLPFPYWQEPPVEPARPVIPFLRGQWLGDDAPPLVGTVPRHLPFPYFEQPAPAAANPVIPLRYGQDVLARPEAFVPARYLRFPYFQEEAPLGPANLVIAFRYGQVVLVEPEQFIESRYTVFAWGGSQAGGEPITSRRSGGGTVATRRRRGG